MNSKKIHSGNDEINVLRFIIEFKINLIHFQYIFLQLVYIPVEKVASNEIPGYQHFLPNKI